MEYIIEKFEGDDNSIESRAAFLAELRLTDVKNGGRTYIYNDLGLNTLQRRYKKVMNQLIEDHESNGNRSLYRYSTEYIDIVKKYILTIKSNPR